MYQTTIDTYNELAHEYDAETSNFWNKFPRTIMNKFVKLTKGKVLDVGSGAGRDGVILKNTGLDVTCIDASESMVNLSRSRGLKSIVGDFESLPFSDKSFDGVWAYTSLLHIPKSEVGKSFEEISRVLKKDGTFCLGLIEGKNEMYRESLGVKKSRWFSFYTKTEIENLLQKNGFKIIYFEKFKPNAKNYLNFISRKLEVE